MDFETVSTIFSTLFEDVNGYSLSTQGRAQVNSASKAYTYGEVAPESFYQILKAVQPQKGEVFYDLGSGTGKATVLAYLLFPFKRAVGIEYLEPLHAAAIGVIHRLQREFIPHFLPEKQAQKIEAVHGDFLEYDLSDADIIFAHSTCFPEDIWEQLLKKWEGLKSGTRVITVTRTANAPFLRHLKSKEFGMAWGRGTVHFYQKN